MKGNDRGLVRYRGRYRTPAMAQLLKASTSHIKARKYAPKGVDPATISPTYEEVSTRLEIAELFPNPNREKLKELLRNPYGNFWDLLNKDLPDVPSEA